MAESERRLPPRVLHDLESDRKAQKSPTQEAIEKMREALKNPNLTPLQAKNIRANLKRLEEERGL